jgi:hypothetical protein
MLSIEGSLTVSRARPLDANLVVIERNKKAGKDLNVTLYLIYESLVRGPSFPDVIYL